MPHRCTTCDRTFPDGSKEMLAGCPGCGGNKFQFLPAGEVADDKESPTVEDSAVVDKPKGDTESSPMDFTSHEDRAQASARSAVVTDDELSRGAAQQTSDPATIEDAEQPDLSELRAELNEQFESIKILQPGEYELNLMELYDRDEFIVALEEDGRYVIDVPSDLDGDRR